MIRSHLPLALFLTSSAALVAAACGTTSGDTKGSGGGSTMGAGAGAGMANATGGSVGTAGHPGTGGSTTTGGAGGAGGSTGGTGATGGTTGGTGATGGTTGGTGATGGTTGGTTGGGAGTGTGMGTGGGAGMGMMMGGAGTGTGGGMTGNCTITSMATQSANIATVFSVTYTTDMANVDSAHIDFGLDTTYGYTAPVDLKDTKTLLLGMKPSKTYHYRVVVGSGSTMCNGPDQTVMTGPIANGIPKATITTNNATALAGGFMVSEWYAGKQVAFILDKDNDVVWWFDPKIGDLTRARMSNDGKYMWIGHGNVPSGGGHMVKVAMDGSGAMDMSAQFSAMNHDFTILPDETMYFVSYGSGGAQCDDIMTYSPTTGMSTKVMNIGTAFSSGACHANAIEYSKEDDTLVVSELDHNAYVKIKRTGEVVWVLGGGTDNDFTGNAATWQVEHNLEVLGANHLLMFNNNSPNAGSNAIELQLDTTAKTATNLWEYTASPKISNAIMGDVQRLPNGNTLVTYSTQGIIHQVDQNKTLLQSISWGAGGATGYVIWRPTLYGAPPK